MSFIVAVVDDDRRVLESLENLLESAGYQVKIFDAGLTLLQSRNFAEVDCLITDISMPGIDGFQLQQLARAARPELPVIFVSGHEMTDDALAAARCSEGFLRKPFEGQALLEALKKALPVRPIE